MNHTPTRLRISGAHVITMDPELGQIPNAEIVIDSNGRIESIGRTDGRSAPPGSSETAEVLDGRGMIALPGFVDTHRHVWVTVFRGLTADLTVQGYRQYTKSVLAPNIRPEDVYAATLVGALEAIDSGTTTLTDIAHITKTSEFADASIDALEASGIRAVYTHTPPNGVDNEAWWVRSVRGHSEDIRRVQQERLSDPDAKVTLAMGMRAVHFLGPGTLERDVEVGRELGLRMIFDGIGAAMGGAGRWSEPGYLTAAELAEKSLIGPDMAFVHCNHVPDSELELLSRHGGHISIAPEVEMLCGYGAPVLTRALRAGLRPSLSSDISTHAASDMFTAMKAVLGSSRAKIASEAYDTGDDVGPWEVTTGDVLEFATTAGARLLGLEHKIGSLRIGKDADLILMGRDQLNLSPMNDPIASVALLAHPGNVDTVIIRGEVVKRAGRLCSPLVAQALADVEKSRHFLLAGQAPDTSAEVEDKWKF